MEGGRWEEGAVVRGLRQEAWCWLMVGVRQWQEVGRRMPRWLLGDLGEMFPHPCSSSGPVWSRVGHVC